MVHVFDVKIKGFLYLSVNWEFDNVIVNIGILTNYFVLVVHLTGNLNKYWLRGKTPGSCGKTQPGVVVKLNREFYHALQIQGVPLISTT